MSIVNPSPMPPDDGKWMTMAEIAAECRVSPRTVMRWTRDHGLPAVKFPGNVTRYRRKALELWIKGLK